VSIPSSGPTTAAVTVAAASRVTTSSPSPVAVGWGRQRWPVAPRARRWPPSA
jgi:hypothetical protein